MSLKTHSLFYYGFEVTDLAQNIDFQESAGLLNAVLNIGSYTLTTFAAELSRALNAAGTLTYTVTVARATRKLTISATGVFTLLVASGSHLGTTAYGTAGFTGADTSSATSHQGGAAGDSYATQFILQSHVDPDDFQGTTYSTVNKSASGKLEVVTYGTENFMVGDLKYITSIDLGANSVVRVNTSGHSDAQDLMNFLTTKAPFEFMADENAPNTYQTFVLESTPEDQKGLIFKLKEMYGQNLPGFYETGLLTFRLQ